MSGTAFPEALDALLTAWTPTAGLDAVIDGEPYDPPEKFLAVGWDRSDQPAVTRANGGPTNLAATQTDEQIDVSCLLSLWDGTSTPAAMRGAVFAALDALDAAVAADPTLGGVVLSARITDYEFIPARKVEGSAAEIRFTIHLHAWK